MRNDPDPVEYVRIAPGRLAPRNGRYELRVTNELEEVLYLDRLRLARPRPPGRRPRVPRRGHDVAAEALPPLRGARPAHAAGDRPPRARRDRAPGGDRSRVRGRPAARARARLREGARAHPRPLRPAAVAHGPAPHRLDRLRLLERQRRRAPDGPRRGAPAARGRARRRHAGRPRSSRWGSPWAGRRRSWWTSPGSSVPRGASGWSRRCGSTGTRPRSPPRRRTWPSRPRPSTPCAPTSASVASRPWRRTGSRWASTTRGSRGCRRGRRCPAATRARATCGRCSPRPTTRSSSRSRATSWP